MEDWPAVTWTQDVKSAISVDLNTLTNQWGVNFIKVGVEEATVTVTANELFDNASTVNINPQNTVVFSVTTGEVLAGSRNRAHIAQVEVGNGTVIILSDFSMLGDYGDGVLNPKLAQALATWK